MSFKNRALAFAALVINAAMLWGTTASAQSVELQIAITKAEKEQQQGQFAEAFKTLAAIKPALLKQDYDSSCERSDEFNLYDKALQKLVFTLLANQKSNEAAITALYITNRGLRNDILLDILDRQCRAANNKPEEFGLMIGKAEKTVLLLTDRWQDDGYGKIALAYAYTRKFDLAVGTLKKMKDSNRRDHYFFQREFPHICHLCTPEDEKHFLDMINLVQSPVMKAKAMLYLADFYNQLETEKFDEDKRIAVLREATELLLPLPDEPQKSEALLKIYQHYTYHNFSALGQDAEEVKNARKIVFESILSIEDEEILFGCLFTLFFRFYPADPSHLDQQVDDFTEKLGLLAEKVSDPKTRVGRWSVLLSVAHRWTPPGSKERAQAFHKAREAALEIGDPEQRVNFLLSLIYNYLGEHHILRINDLDTLDTLLDEIAEIVLTHLGNEGVDKDHDLSRWFSTVVSRMTMLIFTGQADKVLEIIHSPQVPDVWKPGLYAQVLSWLYLHPGTDKSIDWPKWTEVIEVILTIPDAKERFEACRSLADTLRGRRINVDVLPLLDEMLQIAEAEKDRNMFYQMREFAQRYSFWYSPWHENEWFKQCEAIHAERATEQFQRLCQYHYHYSSSPEKSEYGKNFKINQFLEATRAISVGNPRDRLDAFLETAKQADSEELPERAREILDEAIAYAELIPKETRLNLRAEDQLWKIRELRDELQKNK